MCVTEPDKRIGGVSMLHIELTQSGMQLLLREGQTAQAQRRLHSALGRHRRIGDKKGEAITLRTIAGLHARKE